VAPAQRISSIHTRIFGTLRQRGNRVVTNEQFAHWSYAFACFVFRDNIGQQLAYIYYEDEPGRRSAAKLLP
jgi:hypothetical protein